MDSLRKDLENSEPQPLTLPLIVCSTRFFLGLAEAGLFPGLAFYVSLWYPRAERGQRIALFFSAAVVGGAFSGLLA